MLLKCIILCLFILYVRFFMFTFLYSESIRVILDKDFIYPNFNVLSFLSNTTFSSYPIIRNPTNLFERRKYHLKIRAGGKFRIKPKTNHSVAKRFKITSTGKLMYRRSSRKHLHTRKTRGSRVRLHRNRVLTSLRMIRKIKSVLHNR